MKCDWCKKKIERKIHSSEYTEILLKVKNKLI